MQIFNFYLEMMQLLDWPQDLNYTNVLCHKECRVERWYYLIIVFTKWKKYVCLFYDEGFGHKKYRCRIQFPLMWVGFTPFGFFRGGGIPLS